MGDDCDDCTGTPNGDAYVDECGDCNGDGIDEGTCDCDGNLDTCFLCKTINPGNYGDCENFIGYAYTDGDNCELISGCGTGDDSDWFFESIDECENQEGQGCQNCNILNSDSYGDCDIELGWGFTNKGCKLISGCGTSTDDPWLYDSYEICSTRCHAGIYGCTDANASNYNLDATIDDDSCSLAMYSDELPDKFAIISAYPNPFNPKTNINFSIPVLSKVKLEVYNINGILINTLVDSNLQLGYYEINWNAHLQPSGVYFIQMTSKDNTMIKRVTLLK